MPDDSENLPEIGSKLDSVLDLSAFVASAVPMIGGPVSNLLNGFSSGRKFGRVRTELVSISERLKDFESKVSEEYVKTEDFEEILEKMLRQIGDERNDEKRRIYREFLIGIIKSPGESYDDQLKFLRTLEDIQPDHIKVLRALRQAPTPNPGGIGSPRRTLEARLPDLSAEAIRGLVDDLNDLRLTNLDNLGMMMTGDGAENLAGRITPLGSQFLAFIVNPE